jgi:hypothetical protein
MRSNYQNRINEKNIEIAKQSNNTKAIEKAMSGVT